MRAKTLKRRVSSKPKRLDRKDKGRNKSNRNREKDIISSMDVFVDEMWETSKLQQELAAADRAEIARDREAKDRRAKKIHETRDRDQNRRDKEAENSRVQDNEIELEKHKLTLQMMRKTFLLISSKTASGTLNEK